MKRLMPLAAVAATTAALAFAVPATRAEAATPAPALQPGSLTCQLLASQIRFAVAFRLTGLADVLSNVFIRSGCGGAAI